MDPKVDKLVPLRNSGLENAIIVETAVDMDRRQVETH